MKMNNWKSVLAGVLSGAMVIGATPAATVFAEETDANVSAATEASSETTQAAEGASTATTEATEAASSQTTESSEAASSETTQSAEAASSQTTEASEAASSDSAKEESTDATTGSTEASTEASTEEATDEKKDDDKDADDKKEEEEDKSFYVLMNIPYAEFYQLAGISADDYVDVVTSATTKVRSAGLAGAIYNGAGNATNVNVVADVALGVQYAVKVADESLLADRTEVTDETSYSIALVRHGQAQPATTVTGKDALIEAGAYAYYKLADEDAPANYVELTSDGFSAVQGDVTDVDGSAIEITYGGHHRTYEIPVGDLISGNIAAVKVVTDAQTFGLKATDQVWRSIEVGWDPTGSLAASNGATLQSLVVYTDAGIYNITVNQKLKKLDTDTENVSASLENGAGSVAGLPSDIENAKASVSYTEGTGRAAVTTTVVKEAAIVDGRFDLPADVTLEAGKEYTVTVSSDNYLNISASAAYDDTIYVLMNIPYSVFYGLEGAGDVDVVSSATQKTRNAGVAGASYNGEGNGTDLTSGPAAKGVQYAVKVADASLLKDYTQLTNATSYNVAYSGRGKTTEATLTGKAALIQADDYAYIDLGYVPANYLELTADGFSTVKGEVTKVDGTKASITFGGYHTTYEVNISDFISGKIAAVKVVTDKQTFGLKTTGQIWRSIEIGWDPEGNLAATNGATLQSLTVYTDAGVYDITVNQKLLVADDSKISAELGETTGSVSGLPEDIADATVDVSYTVGSGRQAVRTVVVDDAVLKDGSFAIPADAELENGKTYTVTVNSSNYLAFTASVTYLTFTDVDADSWYYDAVVWGLNHNITAGESKTAFGGSDEITRGQVVQFLYRYAGSPEVTGEAAFEDVSKDAFYANAVVWASQNKIVAGYTEKEFAPNKTCTRGQMIQLLYRLAGSPEVTGVTSFTDVEKTDFYYNAVVWAEKNGITAGYGTSFGGKDKVSRAQMITFLHAYDSVVNK